MSAFATTLAIILAGAVLAVLALHFRYQILRGALYLAALALSAAAFAAVLYLALTPPWQYLILIAVGAALGGAIYIDVQREAKRKMAERARAEILAYRAEHDIRLPY